MKIVIMFCLLITLGACSAQEIKELRFSTVESQVYDLLNNMEDADVRLLEDEEIEQRYGFTKELVNQWMVFGPNTQISAIEVAMFDVKEGKKEVVEAKIEKHLRESTNVWVSYLPNEARKVKKHDLFEIEDYLFLIVTKENKKIIDYIKSEIYLEK